MPQYTIDDGHGWGFDGAHGPWGHRSETYPPILAMF